MKSVIASPEKVRSFELCQFSFFFFSVEIYLFFFFL